MKNFSILLVFYEGNISQIKNWKNKINLIEKKGYDVHILFDGDIDISGQIEHKVYKTNFRAGKFTAVYNYLKRGGVKSKYVKVVDPDDLILISELDSVDMLLSNKTAGIIRMPNYRFKDKEGTFNYFDDNKIKENMEVVNFDSFGTAWTILNVESFKQDVFLKGDLKGITFLEDQLLGLISFCNNPIMMAINKNFLVYHQENGISEIISAKSFEECFKVLEEYYSIVAMSKILPDISFPGDLIYLENKAKESSKLDVITDEEETEILKNINSYKVKNKVISFYNKDKTFFVVRKMINNKKNVEKNNLDWKEKITYVFTIHEQPDENLERIILSIKNKVITNQINWLLIFSSVNKSKILQKFYKEFKDNVFISDEVRILKVNKYLEKIKTEFFMIIDGDDDIEPENIKGITLNPSKGMYVLNRARVIENGKIVNWRIDRPDFGAWNTIINTKEFEKFIPEIDEWLVEIEWVETLENVQLEKNGYSVKELWCMHDVYLFWALASFTDKSLYFDYNFESPFIYSVLSENSIIQRIIDNTKEMKKNSGQVFLYDYIHWRGYKNILTIKNIRFYYEKAKHNKWILKEELERRIINSSFLNSHLIPSVEVENLLKKTRLFDLLTNVIGNDKNKFPYLLKRDKYIALANIHWRAIYNKKTEKLFDKKDVEVVKREFDKNFKKVDERIYEAPLDELLNGNIFNLIKPLAINYIVKFPTHLSVNNDLFVGTTLQEWLSEIRIKFFIFVDKKNFERSKEIIIKNKWVNENYQMNNNTYNSLLSEWEELLSYILVKKTDAIKIYL